MTSKQWTDSDINFSLPCPPLWLLPLSSSCLLECFVSFAVNYIVLARIWTRQSSTGLAYLSNIVKFNSEESERRQLRSSTTNAAVVVRTRTQFGKRASSVCGPKIWKQISLFCCGFFCKAFTTHV